MKNIKENFHLTQQLYWEYLFKNGDNEDSDNYYEQLNEVEIEVLREWSHIKNAVLDLKINLNNFVKMCFNFRLACNKYFEAANLEGNIDDISLVVGSCRDKLPMILPLSSYLNFRRLSEIYLDVLTDFDAQPGDYNLQDDGNDPAVLAFKLIGHGLMMIIDEMKVSEVNVIATVEHVTNEQSLKLILIALLYEFKQRNLDNNLMEPFVNFTMAPVATKVVRFNQLTLPIMESLITVIKLYDHHDRDNCDNSFLVAIKKNESIFSALKQTPNINNYILHIEKVINNINLRLSIKHVNEEYKTILMNCINKLNKVISDLKSDCSGSIDYDIDGVQDIIIQLDSQKSISNKRQIESKLGYNIRHLLFYHKMSANEVGERLALSQAQINSFQATNE